jgi:hypothetical protein
MVNKTAEFRAYVPRLGQAVMLALQMSEYITTRKPRS